MNEMIDFLRNNTQLARFSRGEVRDFLERLETEGFQIAKKAEAIVAEVIPEAAEPDEEPAHEEPALESEHHDEA